MCEQSMDSDDKADIAALSAGVVAVAVTLFVAPGSYGPICVVVSVTLLAIILAYVRKNRRDLPKSLALAAAVSLMMLPAIGTFYEAARHTSPIRFLLLGEWICEKRDEANKIILEGEPCKADGEALSMVNLNELALPWLIIVLLVFGVDRLLHVKPLYAERDGASPPTPLER